MRRPGRSRLVGVVAALALAACGRDGFAGLPSDGDVDEALAEDGGGAADPGDGDGPAGDGADPGAGAGDGAGDGDGDGDGAEPLPRANRAFVTSSLHLPSFGGIGVADQLCQGLATGAQLPGTFVAFLWDGGVDPSLRLDSSRGWVDVLGRPIADGPATWRAAPDSERGMLTPLIYDELGMAHPGEKVWFGSANETCGGWFIGLGSARVLPLDEPFHQSASTASCVTTMARLVCLEIGNATPVLVQPSLGRVIFTTRATFNSSAGVSGADALCSSEAASAGLLGTFRAFLAVGSDAPEARFTPSAVPVRRVDGALFARTAAELLDVTGPAYFETFLDLTADGGYKHSATTIGLGGSCGDWSSSSNGITYGLGNPLTIRRSRFRSASSMGCDVFSRLVCLQE